MDCAVSYADSASTIPVYDVGDIARVLATFLEDDVPADPAVVVFRLRPPDGLINTFYVPERQSLGVWSVDVAANARGKWRFLWEFTGGKQEGQFTVQSSLAD